MLIHSVSPILMAEQGPEAPVPKLTMKRTAFGHVEGFDTPEGFKVQRVHTTDLAQYLNKSYTPGSIIPHKK